MTRSGIRNGGWRQIRSSAVILNPEGVKNLVTAFINLLNEILRFAQNDMGKAAGDS